MTESDLALPDGRTLHVYDTGPSDAAHTVVWLHGTPNVGPPPEPLFPAAERLGIRWLGYDRPSYGPSSPLPGRNIASAAADVAALADAFDVDRFAVFGSSGGGPHGLACAALLPDRVTAAVSAAGMAPLHADGVDGLDWWAGINPRGTAELRAATEGAAALATVLAADGPDGDAFTPADHAVLAGDWAWIGGIAGQAMAGGDAGMIADDLAYVTPWGFDPRGIEVPVLCQHGGQDRVVPNAHGRWLAEHCRDAEFRLYPDDGHVSVLRHGESALEWLTGR
jgi:pimeloyl-ACP methyl ester carboxylesterase